MDERFKKALDLVLKHEGGYANNPHDPGGATKYGVSIRYLQNMGLIDPRDGYLYGDMDHDGDIDIDDIQAMTVDEASEIYRTQWWERCGYSKINYLPLAAKVFDFAVNAGPKRAGILLQRATNAVTPMPPPLVEDGNVGPNTISRINGCSAPEWILKKLKLDMIAFYHSLNKEMFINGWISRALDDLQEV